ncbi:MAG: aldose 1-epimerase family protein [Chitinophagaceae bacterium]|nr:aldose 1-epimerase family protein [Chitinophagaceae bacterium]
MFTFENEVLRIVVREKGAELVRLFHKQHNIDYLWNGNPVFWGRHSPVLFPIVGALKNDSFHYKGKTYRMGRHGFARDMPFTLCAADKSALCLRLESTPSTLEKFPFPFVFDLIYQLDANELTVTYQIENPGREEMYFSVGGHPAFKIPLTADTVYDDYFLEFSETERAYRWPISAAGLIENRPELLLDESKILPLSKPLFYRDALVLKNLRSKMVRLRCTKHNQELEFDFHEFPYLGIWAARDADFVCIEPWCGLADSIDSDQQLKDKEGIIRLKPGQVFTRKWSCRV